MKYLVTMSGYFKVCKKVEADNEEQAIELVKDSIDVDCEIEDEYVMEVE